MEDFRDGSMPDIEKLTTREKLGNFGRQLLNAIVRNSEAFTGTPNYDQQVSRGVSEAEKVANEQDY